jgi:hypothetical protein
LELITPGGVPGGVVGGLTILVVTAGLTVPIGGLVGAIGLITGLDVEIGLTGVKVGGLTILVVTAGLIGPTGTIGLAGTIGPAGTIGLAGVKVGGLTILVVTAGLIELIRLGTVGLVGVIEGTIGPETGLNGLIMLVVTVGFNVELLIGVTLTGLLGTIDGIIGLEPIGVTGLIILVVTAVTGLGFKKSKIPENIPFFFTSTSGGVTEVVTEGVLVLIKGFKRSINLEIISFFSFPLDIVSTLGRDILSTLLIGLILGVTVGFTTVVTGLGFKKSKIPENIPFFFTSPSGGVIEGPDPN